MSRVVIDPKRLGETKTYQFDFTSALGVGETISTKAVTATVYMGTDSNPSAIVIGAASSSSAVVSQNITGGVVGVIYYLTCTITTSLSQTLVLTAFLTIIPDVT